MKERIRINAGNLDALIPGESIQILGQSVLIRPLSLLQYKFITDNLSKIFESLKSKEVNFENFREPEKAIIVAQTFVSEFPDLLVEATNIHRDDLLALPLDEVISLVYHCVDVNMKSKDNLLKNFNRLIGTLGIEIEEKKEEKPSQI